MLNKKIIVPMVALIILVTKVQLGIDIPDEAIDDVTNGILAIAAFIGILTNPKKN